MAEELVDRWNHWAPVFDDFTGGDTGDAEAVFLDALAPSGAMLDLGAGTGRVALALARRGRHVTCVDISPEMVRQIQEKISGADLPITAFVGDIRTFTTEERFSCVYMCMNVFYTLLSQEEKISCLQHIRSLLSQDGFIVLECFVPTVETLEANSKMYLRGASENLVRFSAVQVDRARQIIRMNEVSIGPGGTSILNDVQQYCFPMELDLIARLAGYEVSARYGGFERDDFHSGSWNMVTVLKPI